MPDHTIQEPGNEPTHEQDRRPQPEDKLVPVSEAIRYRKRAQNAEQQLEQLNEQLHDLSNRLKEADETIRSLERRQRVDALLMESEAIDLEAARLLTEQAIATMDEPDIDLAVRDLRRQKPYLFRHRHGSDSPAMAPGLTEDVNPTRQAAEQAAMSGNRRDLLRYLRLRRNR
ncbi:MAG: hypothetical protein D6800_04885 [Candidatus Zixiibacteriota bacterium]|nr:MAG: hypothetical protein D6800_04885 [candidate division Zixibacteria bacterium]